MKSKNICKTDKSTLKTLWLPVKVEKLHMAGTKHTYTHKSTHKLVIRRYAGGYDLETSSQ